MDNKIFWIAIAVFVVIAAIFLLQTQVEETLLPDLEAAWVAIEPAGSGVATIGRVDLAEGERFTLRAVVGARRGGDGPFTYYTEATALEIDGERVPADRIKPWKRSRPVRVRWYTIEGRRPFVELDVEDGMKDFRFDSFLQSDWPLEWSVEGRVDAAHDDHFADDSALPSQRFGTQRFSLRFELYRFEDDLVPQKTIEAWGVDDLREHIDAFPTVVVSKPGRVAAASRVFGLTQLIPPADAPPELLDKVSEMAGHRLAFSLPTVLRDHLESHGTRFQELSWRPVDLAGEVSWVEPGTESDTPGRAAAGDLLRVGDRIVVLYEDRGTPGVLDYGDLCFDFVRGAEVRPLEAVFSGGLAVDIANL